MWRIRSAKLFPQVCMQTQYHTACAYCLILFYYLFANIFYIHMPSHRCVAHVYYVCSYVPRIIPA